MPSRRPTPRLVLIALVVLVAATAFAVVCAKGFTEISDDPQMCANCHTMSDSFDSWSRSSHRDVGCNGCHAPADSLAKFWTKAGSGLRHGATFVLDNARVPTITKESTTIVEKNCRYCHDSAHGGAATDSTPERANCTQCHRSAAHPK